MHGLRIGPYGLRIEDPVQSTLADSVQYRTNSTQTFTQPTQQFYVLMSLLVLRPWFSELKAESCCPNALHWILPLGSYRFQGCAQS